MNNQWDWSLPTPYLGINAYRGRNQVDPISGVHTPPDEPNGFESWSFMDSRAPVSKRCIFRPITWRTSLQQFWIKTQSANAGTITVTSPNGGETWQRGTSHTVRWSYTGSPGSTVKIVLLKGGAEVGTIIGSTSIGSSGTGSYTWPVSSTGTTGSDYKVRVQSISQPPSQDTSNNVFTLTPAGTTPTITVTSPNGGETWQRGTSHTVRWSYTGSPGSTVKIVLLKGGAEVGTIIGSTSTGSSGTGSYTWPVSSTGTTGSDYKVRVQSISQPPSQDTSNNVFTLTPAGTTPTITVTSPNGGETWQRGTSHTVRWSYTGSPGSTVKIVLLKGGAEVGTIIGSTSIGSSGTGSYTWPVSSTGTTGSDYKVRVQSINQPTIQDTSNNIFTITPQGPFITVISPNGGETWQRGTSHMITWNYNGLPDTNDVKIVLLKAGVEVGTIASSASTGDYYTWEINPSGTTGSDYQVGLQSISKPYVKDVSNTYFTITPAEHRALSRLLPRMVDKPGNEERLMRSPGLTRAVAGRP